MRSLLKKNRPTVEKKILYLFSFSECLCLTFDSLVLSLYWNSHSCRKLLLLHKCTRELRRKLMIVYANINIPTIKDTWKHKHNHSHNTHIHKHTHAHIYNCTKPTHIHTRTHAHHAHTHILFTVCLSLRRSFQLASRF